MVSHTFDQSTIEPNDTQQDALAPSNAAGSAYQAAAVCGFLVLAVGLIFGQTVGFEFVNLDDDMNVYMNPHVTAGLSVKAVTWAFTDHYVACWMPLTWISHILDCQFYGLNAGGHHLTNVLLYAATVVLLFLVLRRLTCRLWPSAVVAAIFAVHPLRAESVAWVTERKDVLSGLFFVIILAAYVGYARHRFSFVRYGAVIVFFALGLMAKPMLVTLPFVLLLLDYWPLGRWSVPAKIATNSEMSGIAISLPEPTLEPGSRQRPRQAWRSYLEIAGRLAGEKVPLLAMSAISCYMTVWACTGWAYAGQDAVHTAQRFPVWWRLENMPMAYVSYLRMFFYPVDLATPYPCPGLDLSLWSVFGAVTVLVVLTAIAVRARRKYPYLLVGWLWYMGMLVPVSGLRPFAVVMLCDRFTYLPQIGLCLALVWAFADASHCWPRRRLVCSAVVGSLLAVLMGLAWCHTSLWRDGVTLWSHALAHTSRNSFAHQLLGGALLRRGRTDEGIDQYHAAIAIEPDHAQSYYMLGVAFSRKGRLDEAIKQYRAAIHFEPNDALAHNNLGVIFMTKGQLDTAMSEFQDSLRIKPDFAEAHYNAGNIWYSRGRIDEAIAEFQQAIELDPKLGGAHYYLGLVLAKCGRLDEAIAEYRKALDANLEFAAEIHNDLGRALEARGQPEEAVSEYRKALAMRPDFAQARRNLSRAMAGRKRTD